MCVCVGVCRLERLHMCVSGTFLLTYHSHLAAERYKEEATKNQRCKSEKKKETKRGWKAKHAKVCAAHTEKRSKQRRENRKHRIHTHIHLLHTISSSAVTIVAELARQTVCVCVRVYAWPQIELPHTTLLTLLTTPCSAAECESTRRTWADTGWT